MHAYITARHFDLTERIRAHVEKHLIQAIEAHADAHDLNRVEVQLSKGQRDERFTCHVMVQLPAHREVNVTEHHHDLFAAIDLAEKRLLRALIDLRQRQQTTQHHPQKYSQQKVARMLRSN